MFKKSILITFLLFIFAFPARATYEPLSVANNKFGIHILDTSEVGKAAELVGTWGYVTVPIRSNDRDLIKWTKFMNDCRTFKIIPIMRIASFPVGDHWMAPNEYDLVDFANFLDELPWPTKNRYVVVYNEPNHEGEWGGFVYPQEYARVLGRAVDIFHTRNSDFFVIAAGMDASAANTNKSMDASEYERIMDQTVPGIFDKVDGLSYHAYGNPGFSTYPNVYSHVNVASYRYEYSFTDKKPIFLTEVGWKNGGWLPYAITNIWTEPNIVAITPFVLSAQAGPFADFSFMDGDNFKGFAIDYKNLSRTAGQPLLTKMAVQNSTRPATIFPSWTGSLPQILNTAWIGSLLQGFLAMWIKK